MMMMTTISLYLWQAQKGEEDLLTAPEGLVTTHRLPITAGVEVGLMGMSSALWGARSSSFIAGCLVLWSMRRNGMHFVGLGCRVASAGMVACMTRFFIPGCLSVPFGITVAAVLWFFDMELLGDSALACPDAGTLTTTMEEGIEFMRRIVPCALLLHAVRPSTLRVYFRALLEYHRWRKGNGEPKIGCTADLDDSLCRFIQHAYGLWKRGRATIGRQNCVYARCCIQLIHPRLISKLAVSQRALEAWKRVAPSTHFLPIPYIVLVGIVDAMLGRGSVEVALLTWLCYHALVRPGEALRLCVGDTILPDSPLDLLNGVIGVVQIRFSKTGTATQIANLVGVLRLQQVTILDQALACLLWAFTRGRSASEQLFHVSAGHWRDVLSSVTGRFGLSHLQLVPRGLRTGGTTHHYCDHGWTLHDLVPRGRWLRFEATHSYLQAGLYSAISLELHETTRGIFKQIEAEWPRSWKWPRSLVDRLPVEVRAMFRPLSGHGGGWGREQMDRGRVSGPLKAPRLATRHG